MLLFIPEWSWVAYVTDITERAPCRRAREAVGSSQAASCLAGLRLQSLRHAQSRPAESNGGYQTFHLLCMSFLAVLLLEEARHWSHLTGTSAELFHLNYSSYMRAISFKGTYVAPSLPPRCQIKGSVEEKWLGQKCIQLDVGNTISSGTPRPKIHKTGPEHCGLPGPRSIARIYCKKSISGIEALQSSCLQQFWTLIMEFCPSVIIC